MTLLLRLLDVRATEARPVAAAFGGLLFIVVAHTTLETVRDALFLVYIGPGGLGYMYMVTAALALAVGSISSGVGARFGVRRALIVTQLASAAGAAAFCFLPPTNVVLTALYAFSAVSGALLVPQLWATVAASFHPGQGRRLFGTIAVAGVLGAVLGSVATAGALLIVDLRWLFLVSGGAFAISAGIASVAPRPPSIQPVAAGGLAHGGSWWGAFKEEPFLLRIALVVALGAVTTLFVDYLFKATAAARLPSGELGSFFARYYATMNVLALLVQVVFARRILARAGVVGTVSMMPALMLFGSVAGFASGGAMLAVLGTRAVDGALRHSVQRTCVELLYQAVPAHARDRAKPIIDGALTRLSQAAGGALILVFASVAHGSLRALAFVALSSAAAWVAATASLRGPYVALFRRALVGRDHDEPRTAQELDLASVELLVEALSSPRPREVIAAIEALRRRGRAGLVPALVLLRDEEEVLEHALELFASTSRTDWRRFCDRLTSDRRERVRRATMRALARARHAEGAADAEVPSSDERPWIRGYLAVDRVARGSASNADALGLLTDDVDGRETRIGMLTALGDAAPDPRLAALLEAIVGHAPGESNGEMVELVGRAAARVGATSLVPWLVEGLAMHDTRSAGSPHRLWRGPADGRSALRAALAALGQPAFDHLRDALFDRRTPRSLRVHLPLTLAAFDSREAASVLLGFLRGGDDGHVRYRSLRALERMVTTGSVRIPKADAMALARRELDEHFRLLALRSGLEPVRAPIDPDAHDTRALVLRLLDDKCAQALGRTFRLLKLCYPSEDLLRVHAVVTSGEPAARGNAIEFLDALLAPRRRSDNDGVRGLLRLVVEDLSDAERVERAGILPPEAMPRGPEAALALLGAERDLLLATLAKELAGAAAWSREPVEAKTEEHAPVAGTLRPAGAHGR
jgi:AAA family ATP:ADP antiporter